METGIIMIPVCWQMGMGSALETLCGQSVGARRLDLLGLYMQRSWIILLSTALIMSLIYIFSTPILVVIGQQKDIAEMAGKFALWMLPQQAWKLTAYSPYLINEPVFDM